MLFQVYGENALYQWIGWAVVFVGLILINEIARRTKVGGVCCFIVLPIVLTVYFVAISVGAGMGAEWAVTNPTLRAHEQLVPLREALCGHRRAASASWR